MSLCICICGPVYAQSLTYEHNGMLILADISGRVYKIVNFNGAASETTSVSISYAMLGFRQYVLFVKINGETYKCSFFAS